LIVLDASAFLVLVNKEPGWELVARHVVDQDSTISAVNYAEVLQKADRVGIAAEKIDSQMDALGVTVSPFNRLDARLTASFYRHRSGLSLADRVCLALARSVASPAYTADRLWKNWAAQLGVQVVVIRREVPVD
jgi:ribonuclease VapC